MKKLFCAISLLTLAMGFAACSNENEEMKPEEAANLEYSGKYAASWANYSRNVAYLLKKDAQTLSDEWTNGFAQQFKSGKFSGSYNESVQQILDGCIDIANEVGTAKIGEPYDYYMDGKTTQALYAVESWYSWHSRDDYSNNIKSVANSLAGMRLRVSPASFKVTEASANSLLNYAPVHEKATEVWQLVVKAWIAIQDIPQPFRNNIGCKETEAAMEACENLTKGLEGLKALIAGKAGEEELRPIVEQYVDDVVLPTYAELARRNAALYDTVVALGENPSDQAFATACQAWLSAREPWETSEAFLFGPVDEMGLDPNMDSWPLDQVAITNILTSGNYDALNWSDDDDDDSIEAAQALRGFHTLEYLLFMDGKPRTVK